MNELFDLGLVALLLALAGWSVWVRQARAAVIGFMAFGLLLSLAWIRLQAVDIALTEAAIGGGLTGVLLLGACARAGEGRAKPTGRATRLVAAVVCALVTAALAAVVIAAPDPAPTLAPPAVAHLPELDLGNPVTAVLLAYRALDTLLETVVLLLALVGIWSLAPDGFWGGAPAPLAPASPGGALILLARVLPPVGLVIGVHILWAGADEPGGKFQAATLLAAMWLLAMMAGLRSPPALGNSRLRALLAVGPAVFLAIGLAGFLVAGSFLAYPEGMAKPLILLIEVALTVSIAITLGLMIAGPSARAPRA